MSLSNISHDCNSYIRDVIKMHSYANGYFSPLKSFNFIIDLDRAMYTATYNQKTNQYDITHYKGATNLDDSKIVDMFKHYFYSLHVELLYI